MPPPGTHPPCCEPRQRPACSPPRLRGRAGQVVRKGQRGGCWFREAPARALQFPHQPADAASCQSTAAATTTATATTTPPPSPGPPPLCPPSPLPSTALTHSHGPADDRVDEVRVGRKDDLRLLQGVPRGVCVSSGAVGGAGRQVGGRVCGQDGKHAAGVASGRCPAPTPAQTPVPTAAQRQATGSPRPAQLSPGPLTSAHLRAV